MNPGVCRCSRSSRAQDTCKRTFDAGPQRRNSGLTSYPSTTPSDAFDRTFDGTYSPHLWPGQVQELLRAVERQLQKMLRANWLIAYIIHKSLHIIAVYLGNSTGITRARAGATTTGGGGSHARHLCCCHCHPPYRRIGADGPLGADVVTETEHQLCSVIVFWFAISCSNLTSTRHACYFAVHYYAMFFMAFLFREYWRHVTDG